MAKIAKVKFNDWGNTYTYKTELEDLKKGDKVLVEVRDETSDAEFIEYFTPEEKLPFELKNILEKIEEEEENEEKGDDENDQ